MTTTLRPLYVKRIALDEYGRIKEIEFYETIPVAVDEIKMFVEVYNKLRLDENSVLLNNKPINS